jgi:hypothetical protein
VATDAASPQIAEPARIDPELQELLLRNAIMALTVHVLKDPRAGFKQKHYMERNLFIGNHSTGGGVRAFLDRIDAYFESEFMATVALQACKDSQISLIQFGQRIAWLYRVKS